MAASAFEKRIQNRIRERGCLVCGAQASLHHVTGWADRPGRFSRSERLVTPLCPIHHQAVYDPLACDPVSVEKLSHRGFYLKHGIDLRAEAERLWEECRRV